MAKRKRERVPEGLLPADPNATIDPVALWTALNRTATPTPAQARAIAAEANKCTRRAAIARAKQSTAVDQAIARGDWGRVGEWFAAQERALSQPIIKRAEAARDLATGHQLGGAWNEEQQREAARRARPYVRRAAALRAKHTGWGLSDLIAELRRHPPQKGPPLSARTIRRYLNRHGVA